MAKKQAMVCENCKESSELKPGFTFLGFPTMKCPNCNHYNVYQLSSGRRNFYIVLLVIGLLAAVGGLATGQIIFPGLIFIAACIAIYKDSQKRKKHNMPQAAVAVNKVVQSKVKYCGQCGVQVDEDASFCQSCGTKTAKVLV